MPVVAVTGLGAVTAFGSGVPALARGVEDGRCAIGPLTLFRYAGRCRIAAEVPALPPLAAGPVPPATGRRLSRSDRFALAAAAEACGEAGLDADERRAAALFVGGTVGGMQETALAWRRRITGIDRRWRLSRLVGTPVAVSAAVVAQTLGLLGPRATFSTACSSGALAVAEAAAAVERGVVRTALAVGTDALCHLTYAGFDALQALDGSPCRPFDGSRAGLSLGEGAGALVLEDVEYARARGRRILAYVLGAGIATDAYHPTAPHPTGRGALCALRGALAAARVAPEAVDYVNAHGTGTRQNDAIEVAVLRAVFGDRLAEIPVSATKSQLGHTLGAAGAIETVVTVLALDTGVLPPTVNLRTPDEAWRDLDFVVTPGRRKPLALAVTSSYGFGGHDVTLVLAGSRWDA